MDIYLYTILICSLQTLNCNIVCFVFSLRCGFKHRLLAPSVGLEDPVGSIDMFKHASQTGSAASLLWVVFVGFIKCLRGARIVVPVIAGFNILNANKSSFSSKRRRALLPLILFSLFSSETGFVKPEDRQCFSSWHIWLTVSVCSVSPVVAFWDGLFFRCHFSSFC